MTHSATLRRAWCALLVALIVQALACASLQGSGSRTLRLTEVADEGDATRRASTDLVLDGLASDARGDAARALSQYERAIRIDSGNPYAYLALARHHVEQRQARRALAYLDRAQILFESLDLDSPRVEVHLIGLRGRALRLQGRTQEAEVLLAEAARRAPDVWGDGWLDAAELR
jgi:tetratricopeptide (TPR) repeat protein